jgi:hypothetical protein
VRQRPHRPTGPYNVTDSVINGKPVYGKGEVPEGLLTFKQLDQRGRKYAPGQENVAWLRLVNRPYHQPATPTHTALYDLTASISKRGNSPAQQAGHKAMHSQHRICDYCGQKTIQHLLPEQICCECAAEFGDTELLRRRKARRPFCLDRHSALCCPLFRFPED